MRGKCCPKGTLLAVEFSNYLTKRVSFLKIEHLKNININALQKVIKFWLSSIA